MEGDLSLVSVPDLLQMICIGGYSRDLHLFDGLTQLGVIAIRNGKVDRCFGFGMWGEQAFYRLVGVRKGRYKVNEALDVSSASDASLVVYSWQELLMEAARREDEAERAAQQAAAATGRVIAFPSPPAAFEVSAMAFTEPTRENRAPTPPPPSLAMVPPAAVPAPVIPAMPSGPIRVRSDSWSPDYSGGVVRHAIDGSGSDGLSAPHPDIAEMLAEATTCYLRRDLARAEEILQKCLALQPGDKRVLQNLERIRRKKST